MDASACAGLIGTTRWIWRSKTAEGVAFTAAYAGNLYTLADLCRSLQSAGHESILLAGEVAVLLRDAAAVGIDTGARNAVRQRYMSRMREARTEAPQAGALMPKTITGFHERIKAICAARSL